MTRRAGRGVDYAQLGTLGANARYRKTPAELEREGMIARRVLAVLTSEPCPLAEVARRAGVSEAGAKWSLRNVVRRAQSGVLHVREGWVRSA